MSKPSHLAVIGVFVAIGIALTIGGIFALTSSSLFAPKLHAVTFFAESVTGLNIGAPTKFQGVVIGKVTNISFSPDSEAAESYIRVEAEIDVALSISLGARTDFDHVDRLNEAINDGLRAHLATESMVTGIRYIELGYDRDAPPAVLRNKVPGFIEIPSTPSAMAGLTENVSEVVARVGAVDLPAVTQNLVQLLEMMKQRTEELDVKGLNLQLIRTLKAGERAVSAEEISQTFDKLNETLAALQDLATTLKARTGPMIERFDSAAVALNSTLILSQRILENMETIMSPNGSLRYESENAMREFAEMARSLRLLADELERNPGSLLRGKSAK